MSIRAQFQLPSFDWLPEWIEKPYDTMFTDAPPTDRANEDLQSLASTVYTMEVSAPGSIAPSEAFRVGLHLGVWTTRREFDSAENDALERYVVTLSACMHGR